MLWLQEITNSLPFETPSLGLLVVIVLTIGIAYVIRGMIGFGSALIAIPVLTLITDISIAVPTIVLLDYLASAQQSWRQRTHIYFNEIWYLLPFSVLGVGAALFLFSWVSLSILAKMLGGFVLLYGLYSLLQVKQRRVLSTSWALPAGTTGGFAGTLFGTGGPFYAMYLNGRSLSNNRFRATFSMMFILDGFARLAGYVYIGLFNQGNMLLILLALPIMILGMIIGGRLHTSTPKIVFQKIISILLILSGLGLMFK